MTSTFRLNMLTASLLVAALLPVAAFAGPVSTHSPVAAVAGQDNGAIPKGVSNQAFRQSLRQILPLSPKQVREFRQRLDVTRQAMHAGPPPILQSSSRVLNLSPGARLLTVPVAPNYVSSLVFVGSDGSPWPITSYAIGAPKWFAVSRPKIAPGSLLTVAPLGDYVESDLVITLQGRATPVVLELKASRRRAAVLTELRANMPSPQSASAVFSSPSESPTVDGVLLTFLDDVPPKGAVNLTASMRGVEAWSYRHRLYVRTRYTAVWPAWTAHARGDGRVSIYRMPETSSLLLSVDGRTRTIDLTAEEGRHGR
ncbi:MAG: DotH/IcmK family type IV secretion protein [Acidiferrobacterales bacterium]